MYLNLFEQAIAKGELLEFALGRNEYFIVDKDWGVHLNPESWYRYILPYAGEHSEEVVNRHLRAMLAELMQLKEGDTVEKIDTILVHVRYYYMLRSEGKFKSDAFAEDREKIEKYLYAYRDTVAGNKDRLKYVDGSMAAIKKDGGLGGRVDQ